MDYPKFIVSNQKEESISLSECSKSMLKTITFQGFDTHSYLSLLQKTHNLAVAMRFPTMCYVRPAKAQTSLCIHANWSEPC